MKNINLKTWVKLLLFSFVLMLGFQFADVLAQDLSGGGTGLQIAGTEDVQISGDIDKRPLADVVKAMVNYFIGFLGFIAVVTFVYAGVLWVVSGGNDEQIQKAKKIMTYSALGLIVVILSYSIVTFITSSAGGGGGGGGAQVSCQNDVDCNPGFVCNAQDICERAVEGGGVSCNQDADCGSGLVCTSGVCSLPVGSGCLSSLDCGSGQYCSAAGTCIAATSVTCNDNSDCAAGKQCDPFGFCHNPIGGSGANCSDNSDCATGYVCNVSTASCEIQGSGALGGSAVTGGETEALSEASITAMDGHLNELGGDLTGIESDINRLASDDQDNIRDALVGGNLADKMANVGSLLSASTNPEVIEVLEKLLSGLERLLLLREEMDNLRAVMPESEETIAKWDATSQSLDELIDEPGSSIKLRRFEKLYRELKDLVRKFPVVQSKIKAAPGEGNVPFSVTFDGLDSIDPTGGTISDYKWSFLDNNGNLVSLGNSPVIVHEFTEPNTYSVRLQVSTTNTDASGYKLAMDGVSTIRIKARPPASKVAFRVNGVEVRDVHHVTMEEASAGISFDPTLTVPALGRSIEKYEWFYGDTFDEVRTVPATVVHSYSKPGEYFVMLKVTDNQGVIDKRVVKLIVKSLAADIGITPTEGNVNTEFRFRGINSRSDDGLIRSYEWTITDSTGMTVASSDQESFFHTFDRPGTYQVKLLVTDTTGASDRGVRELDVVSRKPIASFNYSIPQANHPNAFEFNAASSYDPDQGDQISYSWDFDGDGQFEIVDSSEAEVYHTYKRKGEYKASLQVMDSYGQRDQIEKNISVDSVLAADILVDKRAAQVGEEITFTADSQNAVAFLWEFGDGLTDSTEDESVTHAYSEKGKYRVKLNFFDRDDNDNAAYTYVLVGVGDEPLAVADVLVNGQPELMTDDLCGTGKHGYIITRSDNLSFSGKESINTDGSSRLLVYDWQFSDGLRNNRRDFTHRFDEVSPVGECSSVSLAVRDEISGKISDKDTLYFKVINKLPSIVDFVIETDGARELVTPTKVKLKVIGAKDEDGQIKKYRWWYYREGFENNKLGLHTTSSPETEMVITAQGEPGIENRYFFVVELTDSDNGIYESTEQFGEVSVLEITNGPNLSPVAEFTVDKTTIAVGDSITFISQSYDPQGDELSASSFQWDFDGDGAFDDTSSGAQVNRQFNTPGEYEVRLKVIHRGLSSSATRSIFVEPTNSFPQAAFTYRVEGNTVYFNGNSSRYDPDLTDTALRFEWDFDITEDANGNGVNDDDVQSSELNPTHSYPEAGVYRARLLVKDSLGMEGVVVRDINLNLSAAERERNTCRSLALDAPAQPITTLDVSISPCQISRGETADISVLVLNANGEPYTGSVFFDLLEGSGDFTPNPVIAQDGKAQAIFTAVDRGAVRIRIRATGTYYGDVTEEMNINVR